MADSDYRNKSDSSNKYFSARPRIKPPDVYVQNTNTTKKNRTQSNDYYRPTKRTQPVSKRTRTQSRKNHRPLKRALYKYRTVVLSSAGMGLIALVAMIIMLFNRNNAYEVYLDETKIGVIPIDKTTTEKSLYDIAIEKLSADVGSKVSVEQKIVLKPVRATSKDITNEDYVLSELNKHWKYDIEVAAIIVDGIEMAVLKSEEEANNVLDTIAKKYIQEGSTLESRDFSDAVKIEVRFDKKDKIISAEDALSKLDIKTENQQTYSVKSGDSLGKIASNNKMTVQKLLEINPSISIDTVLKVGQQINIADEVPIISTIKTVEQITYREAIEKTVESKEKPEEYRTYSNVIQYGKDGEQEVTAQITRINGKETDKKILNTKVITEPVKEIIEIGTGTTPKAR